MDQANSEDLRELPVDLEGVSMVIEGDPAVNEGGYLDLVTGEVVPHSSTDPMMVGDDAAIDVEAEPERWLHLPCLGSRAGWRDMAEFAATVADPRVQHRLERAIIGRVPSAASATPSKRRDSARPGIPSPMSSGCSGPATTSPTAASAPFLTLIESPGVARKSRICTPSSDLHRLQTVQIRERSRFASAVPRGGVRRPSAATSAGGSGRCGGREPGTPPRRPGRGAPRAGWPPRRRIRP